MYNVYTYIIIVVYLLEACILRTWWFHACTLLLTLYNYVTVKGMTWITCRTRSSNNKGYIRIERYRLFTNNPTERVNKSTKNTVIDHQQVKLRGLKWLHYKLLPSQLFCWPASIQLQQVQCYLALLQISLTGAITVPWSTTLMLLETHTGKQT